MTAHVKVGGAWKTVAKVFVKVGGAWKEAALSTKVSGAWKAVAGAAISPVTVSANWGSSSNHVPGTVTSFARTCTVPGGNPGSIKLGLSGDYDGTPQYQINAGSWTTFSNGTDITVANGNTLGFRCASMATPTTMDVAVTDNTTASAVGTWSGSGL